MKREVLRMERITQLANGAKVLNNLNLNIFAGEIMGLVCVDTLGKEELIRLLGHNLPLHYGMVYFRERLVNSYKHSDGTANHIAVIDEHNRLVEDLSVADNIFVLRKGFRKYVIQPRVLQRQLAGFAQQAGIDIRGDVPVGTLDVYEKCVVELLKAVVTGVRLVIVRDISNIISAADLSRFQALLRYYTGQGISFLYLCSHHEEAFGICDRVALMENGQVLRVMEKGSFDEELVWAYALDFLRPTPLPPGKRQDAALRFEEVYTAKLNGLSLTVGAGECVVLLDVNNNTFDDMVALLGGEPPQAGRVLVDGQPLHHKAPGRQVAVIQESPLESMVYYEMSYLDNLCFLAGEKTPALWARPGLKRSIQREYLPRVGEEIYAADLRGLPPRALYSMVYNRVHLANPRVAVCIQPFFGADMYLRHHILQLIASLRERGIGVLLLSVNLSDSLVVADRLLVVQDGRLAVEHDASEFERFAREKRYPV